MKIVVVGLGYVGLSNAVLLAQHNEVVGVDISHKCVQQVNSQRSPIFDPELSKYLQKKELKLVATTDLKASVLGANFAIIATPTNYCDKTNFFDTSSVEKVISDIVTANQRVCIVIKSTVPVGFTNRMKNKFNSDNIIVSPEFLREGRAFHDCLYPTRIVIGEKSRRAEIFADLLAEPCLSSDLHTIFTDSDEAESIKLFSNTYLAMRVAFFNELDSYAMSLSLKTFDIIKGVCSDPRIGNHYNNPSFGYGGYCLPKDTKQLLANFDAVPQNIIEAVVAANETRKKFLAEQIIKKQPEVVGFYRLTMKSGSDNFRESSIQDLIKYISNRGIDTIVYEPLLSSSTFGESKVIRDLHGFKKAANIIVANRMCADLHDVKQKVFTRDIFNEN